ncbi:hypothetical protein RKLH11_4238 [Rhodobacteraceae bacterium KLH11]|nr:hypothetical protein RKLH11_4238 [Rhodobacteraceae bacterium KLH11]
MRPPDPDAEAGLPGWAFGAAVPQGKKPCRPPAGAAAGGPQGGPKCAR